MAPLCLTGLLAAFRFSLVEANAMFLGNRAGHLSAVALSGQTSDLLQDLEMVAGHDQRMATEHRVERLEGALRPMFDAMPKLPSGRVSFDGVRYILRRLFVQRHGWFVNGLDTAGDAWDSVSPTDIFKQHGGDDVHGFFANKLSKDGFDLYHTAVLAATFESLVHADSVERLRAAYRLLGYSESEGSLSENDAGKVIRAYMIIYVLGVSNFMDHTTFTTEQYQVLSGMILEVYPTWPDTEIFVREVRSEVLADVVGSGRTSWNHTLKVLEAIGERYGHWQDKECRVLKRGLVEMERPGTGRVPLDKFYAGGVNNDTWMFMESVPYLEQLGALDNSDPRQLSVIIPNYVNSPGNCVASSKFYSVCCVDECDALLSTLENRIASPEASPILIAQLISGLSSDTVKAPRSLPASLIERLEEISTHHGGRVPLHGRLFAQWMHHAYPRECPYPHLSGTTNPVTAEIFMATSDPMATKDEILVMISGYNTSSPYLDLEMPWSSEEELFVRKHTSPQASGPMSMIVRSIVGLAALSSMAFVIQRSIGSGDSKGHTSGKQHFV